MAISKPGKSNTQHQLDRVRKPRVHITYDVEIEGAIQEKEIPGVFGVLGDFSGQPKEPLPPVNKRKPVEIDRDNFDGVLKGMKPRLAMRVPNRLAEGDDSLLSVELKFNCLGDFEPQKVAQQIGPLKELLEAREMLSDLNNKMLGNNELSELLDEIVRNTDQVKQLQKEVEENDK
ncbi:MAG: type VI secretion system contractile sheath small subunit [Betaproteobacteria bacterium]|nr:type VI secretion system contractile sheath small subunit [Betaproteobacteria bacterium]